jgi:hypothetical protein
MLFGVGVGGEWEGWSWGFAPGEPPGGVSFGEVAAT